jgi:hypothetical protein
VRQPKKAKDYIYRKPGYIYFRHPKMHKLTPMPRDETSTEFIEQHKALKAALKAELKAAAKLRDPSVRARRNRDTGNVLFPAPTLGFFIEKFLASEQFAAYADGTRYNIASALIC